VTEPAQSGGPSPLRVGGLALVGAGAVAALIGLATLLPGGGGGGSATPTTAPPAAESVTAAPTAAPTTAAPASNGAIPVPSFSATPTNAVAAPNGTTPGTVGTGGAGGSGGTGTGAGGSGGSGGGTGVVEGPVRVYNNSTITGLAARAADDFRADGWQVEKVSNYPSGIISTSTVYYRPGTSEQSAASSLGSQFGLRVEPRFTGIDDATPGLIVIVTNDYQKR
jgi:hypothetical protein